MEELSRQARRALARQKAKEQFQMTDVGTPVNQETMETFRKHITVLNHGLKVLDNHMWLLIETLERGGYIKWEDLQETEKIYAELNRKKAEKVKELLAQDLSLSEMMAFIKEDQTKPKLERFNINPVKDLNSNPYEFAQFLMDENPGLAKEQYEKIGKSWGLSLEHFGFKKEGDV